MFQCNPLSFSIGAVLQPFFCMGCEAFQFRPLCDFCRSQWIPSQSPYEGLLETHPLYALWFGNTITYRAFRQWKLTGSSRLSQLLFQMHPKLLEQLQSSSFDAVVPIPQDLRRSWNRGFESARVAAELFSEMLEVPVLRALDYSPPPRSSQQAMKDRLDRSLSPNPFRIKSRWELPENILVVDDIVTTGTTLQQAIATLEAAAAPSAKIAAGALVYKPWSRVSKLGCRR